MHFDGAVWNKIELHTTRDLYAIRGCTQDTMVAVGAWGTVLREHAGTWEKISPTPPLTQSLYAVWCNAFNNIVAVGANRTFLHFNGASWSVKKCISEDWPKAIAPIYSSPLDLLSVWSNGNGKVFVSGTLGVFLVYDLFEDRSIVHQQACESCFDQFPDFWALNAQKMYLIKSHPFFQRNQALTFNGSGVDEPKDLPGANLRAISGLRSDNIVSVGDDGGIFHFNGQNWEPVEPRPTKERLNGVWGIGSMSYYAVGDSGTILKFDGTNWSLQNSNDGQHELRGVWGDDGQTMIAIGTGGVILFRENTKWKSIKSITSSDLNDIWGSDRRHVFVVGDNGVILFYDGEKWQSMPSATTGNIRALWGFKANDIWAVGDHGLILHYDGRAWKRQSTKLSKDLYDIWGSDSHHLYAVGEGQSVLAFDGHSWRTLFSGGIYPLQAIWGVKDGPIYVAGGSNIWVLDVDKKALKPIVTQAPCAVIGLGGTNPHQIIATTACGKILIMNGAHWIVENSPTDQPLRQVLLQTENSGVVLGDNGHILSFKVRY
jgi:photosystem II stability/assembly factor-like uncharacterized protein